MPSFLHRRNLQINWHKQSKYSIYSKILYDFLTYNDFVAAVHLHRQKVNYTYFCHENSTYTWIDHIICERRETTKISSCHIIPEEPGNNSDHLPVQLKYSMSLNGIKEHNILSHNSNSWEISPNWSNDRKVDAYKNLVPEKLSRISPICINNCDNNSFKYQIDQRLQEINNVLTMSTKESGCVPTKMFKPKTYWCPELSFLRDRKRFWWSIWISCDRPRSGIIFNILKDLKRKFRKLSRSNINNLAMKETNIINGQFKNRNMNVLWNKL